MIAWTLIGLYALLTLPLRAGILLRWRDHGPHLAAGILILGFRLTANAEICRDEEGKARLALWINGKERPLPQRTGGGSAWKTMDTIRKSRMLRRMIQLDVFSADIRLGGEDAARIALLCGFLRALNSLVPGFSLRCRPVFGGETEGVVRCIASFRLGMLWTAFLLWQMSRKKEQREEKSWIIPSGT